jgi:hypothetical protein
LLFVCTRQGSARAAVMPRIIAAQRAGGILR